MEMLSQNNYLSTDSAHGGFRFQHSGVDGAADNKPHYTVVTIFNPLIKKMVLEIR